MQPLDLDFDADLVGISCITGTAQRGYAIADKLGLAVKRSFSEASMPRCCPTGGAARGCRGDEICRAVVATIAARFWAGRMEARYFTATGRHLNDIPHARRDLLNKKRYSTVNSIEATHRLPAQVRLLCCAGGVGEPYAHRPIDEVIAELDTFEKRHALFINLSPVEDVVYAKALYRAMIPLRMLGRAGHDPADRNGIIARYNAFAYTTSSTGLDR